MFRAGQKVVCVDGGDVDCEYDQGNGSTIGEICTVTNVYMTDDGYLMLELAEYPSPATNEYEAGWMAVDFRPVVERKTDIGFAQEILRKVPQLVDA